MAKYEGTVGERLVALVAEELGLTREEIVDESTIDQDLAADSLDRGSIAQECEEEFQISIEDGDEFDWRTFGDLRAFIEQKVTERATT